MSDFYGPALLAVVIFSLFAVAIPDHARASGCADLPRSRLHVYDVKPRVLEERVVAAEQLDQNHLKPEGLAARHGAMLSISNVVAWFDITHRIVPREQGLVCNAPEVVSIGFGSDQHINIITQQAAADTCVRQELLKHGAAHAQAFESTVHRFIDEQQSTFGRGMTTLKLTPAPNADIARARWNEGLTMLITGAKERLMADLRTASAQVDAPEALAALDAACQGRVKALGHNEVASPPGGKAGQATQ